MEKPCIFCRIARKEVPAHVVYEDEDCVAFLDIMPRSKGMTIVIPRKHYKEFDEDPENSVKTFQSALEVAKKLKQFLNPLTVVFSVIPSAEVQHFHIRVYPVYEKELPLVESQPKKMSEQELKELAEKIKFTKPEQEEETEREEEVRRSEEEIKEIRKMIEIG